MIEKIFPGLGGLLGVSCKDYCDCTCTSYDPSADDTSEDYTGEKVNKDTSTW